MHLRRVAVQATLVTNGTLRENGESLAGGRKPVDERWGLAAYAGSSFCTSMMSIFARLAGRAGVSPWQIVFVRSVILVIFSAVNLASLSTSPFGMRYGAACR